MRTRILTCVVVLTLIAIGLGHGVRSYAQDGGGPPAVGSPVTLIGVAGTEIAQITVTEVEDPFEDYDPNSPPERSYRFVLLHLEVENTGTRPYAASSYGISLQDADGFLYFQTFISRAAEQVEADPDFPSVELAPGDTASGVVAFQVLAEVDLVRVVYQPTFERLIFLADLTQEGAAPPPDDDEDAATPASAATAGADSVDDADDADDAAADDADTAADAGADTDDVDDPFAEEDGDVASVDVSAADCDDIQEWVDDVSPELDVLTETLTDVFAEDTISVETLEDAAADLEEAAENLRDSDPPAQMEEAADLLAQSLDAYAAVYLEAAEAGDEIDSDEFVETYDTSEADDLLDEAGTLSAPILEACGIDA